MNSKHGHRGRGKVCAVCAEKGHLGFHFFSIGKVGVGTKMVKVYKLLLFMFFFLVVLFQKKKEKKKRFESTEVGMSHLVHKMDSITVLPHSLKIQLSGLTNMQEI